MRAPLVTACVGLMLLSAAAPQVGGQSCCDKARAAESTCEHPCCVAAGAVSSVCFRCNPGATARPFNGKDREAWSVHGELDRWVVGTPSLPDDAPETLNAADSDDAGGALINVVEKHGESSDLYSKAVFGDCLIELELMVPQGSNSGIYVMGEYEVQVLDSYGKEELGMGDMGAIYGAQPPKVNACKPPGDWQTYAIDFRAPRFDADGKKTANARFVKVSLNGETLQEDVEMKGPTPGGLTGREAAEGPLMFQGNHGPVAYRNIRVTHVPAR